MQLQPKINKYKNIQKKRTYKNIKFNKLAYGHIGLMVINPCILTSKHLFRFILFMKKATRRTEKTFRFFWIYIFPSLPLTRKSLGLRMGKGKGKRQTWMISITPGTCLFELRNLRYGRAIYFLKQLNYRINNGGKIVRINNTYHKTYFFNNIKTPILPFW